MKKPLWYLQVCHIDSLREHPRNARRLTKKEEKHLRASIERFGMIDKPIVTKDGLIIGGHQRIKCLKKLGAKHVECWVPDCEMTDEEVDELNIRMNRNQGSWDWDKLANEWDMKSLMEWGFETADFEIGKIEDIEGSSDEEKAKDDKKIKTCPHCGLEI